MSQPDLCQQCAHLYEPHSLVAVTGNPMDGGIILCPEPGCVCYSTWSVPEAVGGRGKQDIPTPDRFELERIREVIQS